MDLRTATKIIVSNRDFVFADAHKELLDAWQYVIDTSQVAQLPNDQPYGRYNRTATRLIEAGVCKSASYVCKSADGLDEAKRFVNTDKKIHE